MCVRIPWHSYRILMLSHAEDIATFARGNVRFDAHWPLCSVIRTRPTKHCVSIKFLCLPSILTPIPINSCQNIGFYPRSITPLTLHRAYVHYDRTHPLLPRVIRPGKTRYYFTAAKSTLKAILAVFTCAGAMCASTTAATATDTEQSLPGASRQSASEPSTIIKPSAEKRSFDMSPAQSPEAECTMLQVCIPYVLVS